jgi:enoyl-CoA hydratase/carnithine racemase
MAGQAADDSPPVLVGTSGAVMTIILNRPEQRNAWTLDLEREYFAALRLADAERDIRAVVVTAAGDMFCPGADKSVLQAVAASGKHELRKDPLYFPLTICKPVIMAINGSCAGVGLLQALAGDVRFAARGAKFATGFVRRGLIAEYGLAWLLQRVAGASAATDLLLSGRAIDADEAARLGLVNRVHERDELLPAALAYASDIARHCSPASVAAIKAQLQWASAESLPAAAIRAAGLVNRAVAGPDFAEGVASFLAARSAAFPALGEGTRYSDLITSPFKA